MSDYDAYLNKQMEDHQAAGLERSQFDRDCEKADDAEDDAYFSEQKKTLMRYKAMVLAGKERG
jgi:hypothetical protein